jgi:hypothetical protein
MTKVLDGYIGRFILCCFEDPRPHDWEVALVHVAGALSRATYICQDTTKLGILELSKEK